MKTSQIPNRIYGLDIMRATAIFYVMLSHGYEYSHHLVNAYYYKWLILDGVGLFFVLSGFLVGGILIREIETSEFKFKQLIRFWIHRWLRTLPAYFCVLTFLLICYYINRGHLPPVWFKYYIFMQNFTSPHPIFFSEAWSLSVEECFYVLVPLCIFFLVKLTQQKRWPILGFVLFTLFLITSIRLCKVEQYDYFAEGSFGDQILKVVITRMDSILYGVLGAWLSIYFPSPFYKYKNILLTTGILLLIGSNLLFSPFFLTHVQYSLVPFASLCLLPFLGQLKRGNGILSKPITFISIISYSMYLTNHMIVLRGVMPFIIKWLQLDLEKQTMHNLVALILFWILTIGMAYALYRCIEKPFMNLRKRLID